MIKNIIPYIIWMLGNLHNYIYSNDKSKLTTQIVNDYSERKFELYLQDFIDANDKKVVQGLYDVLNWYYNSKLSNLLVEWNNEEIWKLKYLLIVILDIKDTLNNNSK